MPLGTTPDMLVVLDEHPNSHAGLAIAQRYARGIVALASSDTATDHIDAEVRASVSAAPTIDEALRVAAERRTPWVAMRRDLAEPERLLAELLIAAAAHTSGEIPGFAVFLADGDPRPFQRILAIVDRGAGPVSGLLAYISVAIADNAGAEIDVLVLGAEPSAGGADSPVQTLAVNRERELLQRARDRANESGLDINWIMLTESDDPWSVIQDQLSQHDYDLIIDDLGDVRLSRTGRVGRVITKTVAEGQVGEIPLRLLREVPVPLLLVIDEIRLGMAPASMLKLGAAAAMTIGLASTSALTTSSSPVLAQSPETANTELLAEELAIALGLEESPEQKAQKARAKDAARSSRGGEGSARTKDAPAKDSSQQKVKEPKAPKGGADPRDVEKAKQAASADRAAFEKDKQQREAAKSNLAKAEKEFGEAQEQAERALEELTAASQWQEQAEQAAEEVRSRGDGVAGILPGAPSDEEIAQAERIQEMATDRVDLAMEQGQAALADLERAQSDVEKAEAKLEKRRDDVEATKADYEFAQEKVDVYQASLAKSRQSPVAGGYRLTARFGNTGGYWSSGVHTGLDFAAPMGTDIRAAGSGTVTSAGWAGAYGNQVVIDHGNGYTTTYAHLSDIDVSVGQRVQTGDHLGDMGSTGNSTGSHLHFEVKRNGQFVDPEAWLGW